MFKAYFIQFALIVVFGIITAILGQSVYEFVFLLMFWAFYSALIITGAWLIVHLPFYILTYKAHWLYSQRWTALWVGIVTGFIVPFGVLEIWDLVRHDGQSGGAYLFFAILAAITGGTAGEVGCRLRRKALRELNPEYDLGGKVTRKTGPLKIFSEI